MNTRLPRIEMMRGLAAVYVLASHLPGLEKDSWLGLAQRFGQEAVILFFLISGFVVHLSTARRRPTWTSYLGHRAQRIYPIYLLTLGLLSVDLVCLRGEPLPVGELLGNLFMLQDFPAAKPALWFAPYGGNFPLWSLAYEWWAYLLFYAVWRWVSEQHRRATALTISVVGLISCVFCPSPPGLYLSYFVLWWTGAELARQYLAEGTVTFRGQGWMLASLTGFTLFAAILLLATRPATTPLEPGLFPVLLIRHFGAALAITVGALIWHHFRWRGFDSLFGIFARVAPISYGLYLLHYPLVQAEWLRTSLPPAPAVLLAVVGAFALAGLAEGPFQSAVKRLFRRTAASRTNGNARRV